MTTKQVVASAMVLAVGGSIGPACAQSPAYPSRPITFIVASAPGGTTDFTARLLAEPLSKALKQSVVVDNRGGGSGNIGTALAAKARPDGHTLLVQYSGYHVANPSMFKELPWSPTRDFTSIGMALVAPHVFAAHPSLPVKNLSDLGRLARSQGGALSYASSGIGSIQHIGTELFLQVVKAKMVHVPYKGAGPAVIDLLSGQVAVFNTTPPSLIQHVRNGRLRALAYLSKQRHPTMSDIPTSAEAGLPGYEVESWFAVFAPAGTPRDIVDRLSAEVARIVNSADFKRRAEDQGAFALTMDPKALDAYVVREIEQWAKVIRTAGITME